MTRHVLLNNIDHKDLKIITRCSAAYGHQVSSSLTFPTEFCDVQAEYPILFRKDSATGEYQPIAIFGLEQGENLFLDEVDGWTGKYLPASLARGPFLIGFQNQTVDGQAYREPVIHIDMDDPRVSWEDGEPVFLKHGGNSPYLQRVTDILQGIYQGLSVSKAMFSAFEQYNLIEPVKIEVVLHSEKQCELVNYHTVSEEKLLSLDGNALQQLNRAGFLQAAFLVVASLNNIKKLIDIKNRREVARHSNAN